MLASAPSVPETPTTTGEPLKAQGEITVYMRPDTGRALADADIAALRAGNTVTIRTEVPETYFHQLRLHVARDPDLARRIAVLYAEDGRNYNRRIELGPLDSVFRWPVGFLGECLEIEMDIQRAYHPDPKPLESPRPSSETGSPSPETQSPRQHEANEAKGVGPDVSDVSAAGRAP